MNMDGNVALEPSPVSRERRLSRVLRDHDVIRLLLALAVLVALIALRTEF